MGAERLMITLARLANGISRIAGESSDADHGVITAGQPRVFKAAGN
jgi:hypothetical protein